jgi:hypothetical protein
MNSHVLKEKFLTTKEVWKVYRISKFKLYELRKRKLIDRYKLESDGERSKALWKIDDIESLISKG